MLDVGFSELLLILVAAIIFIGPKDMPVVIRHIARFIRGLRAVSDELKGQVRQMMDEAGLDEATGTIIDLEGRPQKAYDVRTLENLAAPKPKRKKPAPPAIPPQAGEE